MARDDKSEKPPFWSTLPGILTGLAALLAAIVGLITALNPGASSDSPKPAAATGSAGSGPRPSASITDPGSGDEICRRQKVTGVAKGVPESDDLWLFVYAPRIERYFTADQARRNTAGGRTRWSAVADVSDDQGDAVGRPYQLMIYRADESARGLLTDLKGRGTELRSPPGRATRLDSVFVTTTGC